MPFQVFSQLDAMDCGPTCLRMVAKHYGVGLSAQGLREAAETGKDGVNLLGIAQAAEHYGFRTLGVKVSLSKLKEDAPLPCIVHWGQNHFVVVYKISLSSVCILTDRNCPHRPKRFSQTETFLTERSLR
jgi:ATP-binding cassette, subfamily B, bacterial